MYFSRLLVLMILSALELAHAHLCIVEPRQRLEVTGTDDYYLDCYYYNGPCGNRFNTATPYTTTLQSGSSYTVKLYTPVIHSNPGYKGYFQVNLMAADSANDYSVQLERVSDDTGKYHDVQVTFPDVEGSYTLQVIHYPYRYVPFYSCSDIVLLREGNTSSSGSHATVSATKEISPGGYGTVHTQSPGGYNGTGSGNMAATTRPPQASLSVTLSFIITMLICTALQL